MIIVTVIMYHNSLWLSPLWDSHSSFVLTVTTLNGFCYWKKNPESYNVSHSLRLTSLLRRKMCLWHFSIFSLSCYVYLWLVIYSVITCFTELLPISALTGFLVSALLCKCNRVTCKWISIKNDVPDQGTLTACRADVKHI